MDGILRKGKTEGGRDVSMQWICFLFTPSLLSFLLPPSSESRKGGGKIEKWCFKGTYHISLPPSLESRKGGEIIKEWCYTGTSHISLPPSLKRKKGGEKIEKWMGKKGNLSITFWFHSLLLSNLFFGCNPSAWLGWPKREICFPCVGWKFRRSYFFLEALENCVAKSFTVILGLKRAEFPVN